MTIKRTIQTLAISAILLIASPIASAKPFNDVSSTYQNAVTFLLDETIATGFTPTEFGTTRNITRGDAATMIANYLKLDTTASPDAGFTDTNTRVRPAINALFEQGIINGKTPTTFEPEASITRQEMAKILAGALKIHAQMTDSRFIDVSSVWAPFVEGLAIEQIAFGKTETLFEPYAEVTRGEFALFLFRGESLREIPPAPPEEDKVPPELDYTGSTAFSIPYNATYSVPAIAATDEKDGPVEVTLEILYGSDRTPVEALNTQNAGRYFLVYSATDSNNNMALLEIQVTVRSPK